MFKNEFEDYVMLAERFSGRLIRNPSVMGICFLGGIGKRQYIDKYSDLDLAVFVDRKEHGTFLPPFSFSIKHRDRLIEFNISQHAYEDESKELWDEARIAAYQNAHIYFDRDGYLTRLLKDYVDDAKRPRRKIIINLNQIWWRGIYHSYAMLKRGDSISANLLLNEAVGLAVETLSLLRDRHHIHTKWAERFLQEHPRSGFLSDIIRGALKTDCTDVASTIQRRRYLVRLYRFTLKEAKDCIEDFPKSPYKYWADKCSNRQLGSDAAILQVIEDCAHKYPLSLYERKELYGALSFAMFGDGKCPADILPYIVEDGLLRPELQRLVINLIEAQEATRSELVSISNPVRPSAGIQTFALVKADRE